MVKDLIKIVLSLLVGAGITYFVLSKYSIEPLCKLAGQGAVAIQIVELQQTMRKLWSDHVFWTRDYIIAAVAGTPDAQAAVKRLMKNQEDLGGAVGSVYGKEAGEQMTKLLKEHISLAAEVVKYAKENDQNKLKDADDKWHQNAVDIATFLHQANPDNWPQAALVAMLNEHLALTTQEAVARIKQEWEKDVTTFDHIYEQALMMADALTEGIAKQKLIKKN
jgi:hypothetical protein